MGADFFFRMGATHHICQDYAAAGEDGNLAWAALSDGCSSSDFTDFGSRFLVRAFVENVAPQPDANRVVRTAARMVGATGLPAQALDATLLYAVSALGIVTVGRFGDGVVAWRNRDGLITFHDVEFDEGAPLYLNYRLNEANAASYRNMVRGCRTRSGTRFAGESWTIRETAAELGEGAKTWTLFEEDIESVLLFSDGVGSFQDPKGNAVPVEAVVDEMFAMKSFAGQFIARRAGAFLSRFCAERGWKHADDFSVAGLHFEAER